MIFRAITNAHVLEHLRLCFPGLRNGPPTTALTSQWSFTSTKGAGRIVAIRRSDGFFEIFVENDIDLSSPHCLIRQLLEDQGVAFEECVPMNTPNWI